MALLLALLLLLPLPVLANGDTPAASAAPSTSAGDPAQTAETVEYADVEALFAACTDHQLSSRTALAEALHDVVLSQMDVSIKQDALAAAQAALAQAEEAQLMAVAAPEDVTAAQEAVDEAQTALQTAQLEQLKHISSVRAMTGVDISPTMLTAARRLADDEGVRCEFLLGDITKLKLTGAVYFSVAINDCLNYVAPSKLKAAFGHVANCLVRGGIFHFDISSERKLRSDIGENMFGDAGEDISYIWFNTQEEDGVTMELTFFVRGQDGRYTRFDETHRQYAHSEQSVVGALHAAGFAKVFVQGHLGGDDKSQRINFTCIK